MLAGAWGTQAGELLARAGARVHRIGQLTIPAPPEISEGRWCAWLWGAPRARATLGRRYGEAREEDVATLLARALLAQGPGAAEHLCGRFVLVVLDRERDSCAVARDQLGAQPLVYRRLGDGALFAEHERDLLASAETTPRPDRLALLQWIDNGVIPEGRTLYDGLSRLPPGCKLSFERDATSVERWWQLRYEGTFDAGREELAELLRDAGFAAVQRAAAGAERVAVKLSGGLDSACVAAGLDAAGVTGEHTIALGGSFAGYPDSDEQALIEQTARHTGIALQLIRFSADRSMLAPALEHIERWRLPPATPNLFLWEPLMARARELGVEVMLDGEGGDEVFGATPYLIADMLRAGRVGEAWSLTGGIPGIDSGSGRRARLNELRRYGLAPLLPRSLAARRAESRARRSAERSLIALADRRGLIELEAERAAHRRDGPIWWRSLAESVIEMRDLLDMGGHYRRLDAQDGVERNHPFLHDLELIEAVLRIPPREQFDASRDRPLLRDGLRGLIPETVRTRGFKSHFTLLVLEGIERDEAGIVGPLRASDAPIRDYVTTRALDRRLAIEPAERPLLVAASMWRLGIANRWLCSQETTR